MGNRFTMMPADEAKVYIVVSSASFMFFVVGTADLKDLGDRRINYDNVFV